MPSSKWVASRLKAAEIQMNSARQVFLSGDLFGMLFSPLPFLVPKNDYPREMRVNCGF